MAGRRTITVVEYGITSGEDNLREFDSQGRTSFVLSSTKLLAPLLGDLVEPSSPEDSDEAADCTDSASAKETNGEEPSYRYSSSSSEAEEERPQERRRPKKKGPRLVGTEADSNRNSSAFKMQQLP